AVETLGEVIVRPTLNLPTAEASLALGAFTFRTALLAHADAGDIGFHHATLSETIGQPAERALGEAGVEVKLGWRAQRLRRRAGGFEVGGGEEGLCAPVVIVGVPPNRASAPVGLVRPGEARRPSAPQSSPSVNPH